MLVLALVSVVVTGSMGTGGSLEPRAPDLVGAPRAARLLAADEGLGAPAASGVPVRPDEHAARIALLEQSRPSLATSIAGVVLGSLLVLPGAFMTFGMLFALAFPLVAGAPPIGVLVLGALMLAAGVTFIVLGAIAIGNNTARNAEIDRQVETLRQELRQLGPPTSSPGGPAPALTLATF